MIFFVLEIIALSTLFHIFTILVLGDQNQKLTLLLIGIIQHDIIVCVCIYFVADRCNAINMAR